MDFLSQPGLSNSAMIIEVYHAAEMNIHERERYARDSQWTFFCCHKNIE